MNRDSMFAIVDIETTGTNPEKDKIIQFACVLVEHGKIVNHFSTDVNPLKSIPKNIERLTGISNQQVAHAPYFEDVAGTIIRLLDGCVFVAHNVYFDYSFLNSELRRAGEEELNLECLDTVELAQVSFPRAEGYRVGDLADYLKLTHDNPHQALSDAYVTAELFIQISHKLTRLPFVTLDKLLLLSDETGVNNSDFIQLIYSEKQLNKEGNLPTATEIIGELALRVKEYQFKESKIKKETIYPKTLEDKTDYFEGKLNLRLPQIEMMDKVHDFLQPDCRPKNFIVEASTGIGKTLGYLFPASFKTRQSVPVIISTATILLQEQLLDHDIPLLSNVNHQDYRAVLLKSQSHYLNLQSFYQTLQHPVKQKQYALYQMAVLVWLLETDTGDLDELTINKQHLFYEHVRHRGISELDESSVYYESDFLRYVNQKKEHADFIVVNHAFLCEEDRREVHQIPKSDVLIIDEAQKLLSAMEERETTQIHLNEGLRLLKMIKQTEEITNVLASSSFNSLNSLIEMLSFLSSEVKDSVEWLSDFILQNYSFTDKISEQLFTNEQFETQWPTLMKKNLKQLHVLGRELRQLVKECQEICLTHHDALIQLNYFMMSDYLLNLSKSVTWLDKLTEFFKPSSSGMVKWFKFKKNRLSFHVIHVSKINVQDTSWYQSYDKIIYTGGTLQLDVSSDYFETQLGLSEVKKEKLTDTYHYDQAARLFVVTPETHLTKSQPTEFAKYIASVIHQTYQQEQKSMLVLFTSHDLLRNVYDNLHQTMMSEEVELLAQGITGTKEKIVKRFSKIETGIILGANSFWEGIDFPDQKLEIIIMTKLPFDPPTRPIVEAKYDYLQSLGKNPFYEEAIPQAGMRLRQGIGRLLRSEQDKGVVILLDNRLVHSTYSKEIRAYLPKQLPVETLSIHDMLQKVHQFLNENN
ncbi:MAG: helicase C-terminal domain-containing protein [Vagococcus sp.]